MRKYSSFIRIFWVLAVMSLISCSKSGTDIPLTIFTADDDIALGEQFDQEIRGNPAEYPILDSVAYPKAYQHLYGIRNAILASGKLDYPDKFSWRIRIIRNDTVLNAFCVPGGNIYIYTGIIKFLDNEAQFAGVLAHEMVHADHRHTSEMLTLQYGEQLLLNLILGKNPNQIAEILAGLAQGLGNLAYSRSNEYEADAYAVRYLYVTKYDAASLGDFFAKMESQPRPPVFLSTHPSPEDRLQKINETFQSLGGVHGGLFQESYQQFKSYLP